MQVQDTPREAALEEQVEKTQDKHHQQDKP